MEKTPMSQKSFIEALLVNVPFDGWSQKAIQVTAKQLNMKAIEVKKLFPRGLVEVIEIYSHNLDAQMVDIFLARFTSTFDVMPLHIKIKELLIVRFEILQGRKEATKRLTAFFALPQNTALSTMIMYKTLDKIWRTAGDRSTDLNFYTKRGILGLVYCSTLLAFFDDDTPDLQKTQAFLDRRLKDTQNLSRAINPFKKKAAFVINKFFRNVPANSGV